MNRLLALTILAFMGTAPAATGAGASITGRVLITKALTKKRVVLPVYGLRGRSVASEEPESSEKGATAALELSRVVVYLEGAGLNAAAPVTATLTQKNRRFDPQVVVVPVGSTVSFPNEDPIFHNVFSLSKARSFDLGYYPAGKTRRVKFNRPGLVQVYCHLHADMNAAILVLPTAKWTRPEANGRFLLQDIPAGAYDLVVWHRSAGFFYRRVALRAGETLAVNVTIPLNTQEDSAAKTRREQ